jgi:non-specific serine/threonine protein kinase/serine/threonine-protein kinase
MPSSAHPANVIPGIHLLQKLGEGGMGEVWKADQTEPVRRRVALKLIKRGMESKEVLARFESERQALALMSHPNIAQVYDAGITQDGRPYFVMELVKGVPITKYCDTHRLDTNERLELFSQICDGVQHAHHKGVIHRDIKPSNILVKIQDDKPTPKIIDFGVAKATAQRLTEKTVFTELGQLIGTPEYMSPEQAEMTGLDIDTRTDVYSLGVVLYELLVGTQPFDSTELRSAGFDEIRRKIREEEPPRPSTRITKMKDESTAAATNRRSEPAALARDLHGDLDWITMKALEKDRTRRYGSPAELAADIGRHLRHQPVEASPPSTIYRVEKFIRRHTVGVAATALVLVALVLGVLGTTFGMIRARQAERLASQEAETAKQISDFLIGLFEVSDPTEAKGETITAREILDQGADQVRRELEGQPLIQARLMNTMGTVYTALALYEQAQDLLTESLATRREILGNDHPEVAESIHALADVRRELSEYEEARPLFEEALRVREQAFGADDLRVAETLYGLAIVETKAGNHELSGEYLDRALAIKEQALGPDDPEVAKVLNAMASLAHTIGELERSRELHERALEIRTSKLGPDHPDVATTLSNLAIVVAETDDLDGALRLNERALGIREAAYGPVHPMVAASLNNQGFYLELKGDFEAALPLYQRALKSSETSFGQEHPTVARALLNIGIVHSMVGDYAAAKKALERSVEINEKVLGPDHSYVGSSLGNLAIVEEKMGSYEDAVRHRERSVEIYQESLGPDHPAVADGLHHLGDLRAHTGRLDEALSLYERALEIRQDKLGPEHSEVARVQASMAVVFTEMGRFDRARTLFESALAIQQETLEPDHHEVAETLTGYGELLVQTQDYEAARTALERALEIRESKLGSDHPELVETLEAYADLLRTTGHTSEAEELDNRAAAIRDGSGR